MPLDWDDFSGDSGSPALPLLLSERSQSIALAAIYYVQFAWRWGSPAAAEWDEIESAISECLNELMELQMPDFSPVGAMVLWIGLGADVPEKWLLCDGGTFSGDDYPELFAVIDDSFKDGFGNFVLPDMHDRFVKGVGSDSEIGALGGENQHILTISEIPAHNHIQRGKNTVGGAVFHSQVNATSTAGGSVATTTPTSDTGGGAAHNNMPAYFSSWWIIKALP